MKTKKLLLMIPFLLMGMGMGGCDKDEPYTSPADPKQVILGKWELIEKGGIQATPLGYKEFLADSVVRDYDYKTEQFSEYQYIYSINDEVLLIGDVRYSYAFFEDKMKLNVMDIITIVDDTQVYQRKK